MKAEELEKLKECNKEKSSGSYIMHHGFTCAGAECCGQLLAHIISLEQELEHSEQQVDMLFKVQHKQVNQIEKLQRRLGVHNLEFNIRDKETEKLIEKITDLEREKKLLQEDLIRSEKISCDYFNQILVLKKEITQLQRELEAYDSTMGGMKKDIDKLKRELGKMKKEQCTRDYCGYSQEIVDAIVKERDQLRAALARMQKIEACAKDYIPILEKAYDKAHTCALSDNDYLTDNTHIRLLHKRWQALEEGANNENINGK